MFSKRFLSLMLMVALCVIVRAEGVEAKNNSYEHSMEALIQFGIIRGEIEDIDKSKKMTREEAALWIYDVMNLEEEYQQSIYEDVQAGTKYNDAITALTSRGVVSGCGDGSFDPKRVILNKEFIKMVVDVMDYEAGAEVYGGYPAGYIKIANNLEINCGIGYDEELKVDDAAKILYNAVKKRVGEYKPVYTNRVTLAVDDEDTLLSKYRGIYMVEGMVTENELTALTSPEGCGEACVKIGKERYYVGETPASQLLGKKVTAFYKDLNGKYELVFITADEHKYQEKTVFAKDISEESTRTTLLYYPERDSGRVKRLKISDVADVIYNGRAYPDLKDIYPEIGEVRLLDYDSDNTYDVVFVTDYEVIVADGMSENTNTLVSKYTLQNGTKSIVFGQNDVVEVVDEFGEALEYADIMPYSVVMLATSATGRDMYHKLVIVQNDIKGIISSIGESYTISGTEYDLSKAFENCINSVGQPSMRGQEITFYLDLYGDIVGYKAEITGKQYGYIRKIYNDWETDKYMAKIFCSDGVWRTLEIKEKVAYNSQQGTDDAVYASLGVNQMIRFEVDRKERISSIDTATSVNVDDAGFKNSVKLDTFRKSTAKNSTYLVNSNSFYNEYFLDEGCIVFIIPDGDNVSNSDFRVEDKNYFTGDNSYNNVVFYDTDKFHFTKVIALKEAVGTLNLNPTNYFFMVDKQKVACIDDEIVSIITGVENGNNWSYTGSEADTFDGLKKGDLIRTAYDSFGRIYNYELVHRLGKEDVYSNISDINPRSSIVYGKVVDIDLEGLRMIVDDGTERVYRLKQDIPVIMYKIKDEEIVQANIKDIRPGDYVCIRISYSIICEIAVYTN